MKNIGISGKIADFFLTSKLTPLIAITAILLGIAAVIITPREEEPQISVPMVDIFIPFPGASAKEVESLVARPAERVLSEINGVEYTYSMSKPGMALITVRFLVGEDENDSVMKVYDKLESNKDWIAPEVGVLAPTVRPTGINDVPIVTLTLWSKSFTGYELLRTAHNLEEELQKINGTAKINTIGGSRRAINVYLDPGKMTGHNVTPLEIYKKLADANVSMPSGKFLSNNKVISVETGEFLQDVSDVKKLVVALNQGKPVYLSDVADVIDGAEEPDTYVWLTPGASGAVKGLEGDTPYPAVTVTIAKKEGQNAVTIANNILKKVEDLKGFMIPEGINVTVTRNYGETADHKANELLEHLLIATIAVVFFIAVTLGRSAGVVVTVVIPITILLTLFSSYFIGFTINRVSLFALIFSIGILVDDAIVVVENMYRRRKIDKDISLRECAIKAVDEVGNPTILATFTVIAALLPMAFVTGLMGPYMGPIPINASSAMFFSLLVAFIITPWMTYKMMLREKKGEENAHDDAAFENRVEKFYRWFLTPLFQDEKRRKMFFGGILFLFLFSLSLTYFKAVVLKMLPFDNKSEVMLVIDLPESSSLENTAYVAAQLGDVIKSFEEVTDFETYIGTASPMNFNGLVRHYYIKKGDNVAEIQINLIDKSERDDQSHGFAQRLRSKLLPVSLELNANVKVVEVPPGPPVLSPLVAEVYGPDREYRAQLTKMIRGVFEDTEGIIEVDDMIEEERDKITLVVDKEKATLKGVSTKDVVDTVHVALQGQNITALHLPGEKYYLPIKLRFSQDMRDQLPKILDTKIRSESGRLISLHELVDVVNEPEEVTIFHKNLRPVDYILADAAGEEDSPLYGLFKVWEKVQDMQIGGGNIEQYFINQPASADEYAIKWDGEFQITYETFRDMAIAYAAGLVLIYLLVVGQFRSFMIPLIIMAPIPLTLIGIFPGHAIMGAQFTATSMIGAIALAGIIVRNSILLVDFTLNELKEGVPLEEAVIKGGAARLRPIVLTASAAMVGAFVIIFDPIFQGLAISLLFGVFVSTLLTLVVIPLIFYMYFRDETRREAFLSEIR